MTGISLNNGTVTITPQLRNGFGSSNSAGTIVHRLLNGDESYSLQKDGSRSGSLDLLFTSAAAAEAARLLLVEPSVWTITDDLAAVSFKFVRAGELGDVQNDSRKTWLLSVGYKEVAA